MHPTIRKCSRTARVLQGIGQNLDVFVHHTGIAGNGFKSLDEGAKVSYEATQGRKGMQADNVSAD